MPLLRTNLTKSLANPQSWVLLGIATAAGVGAYGFSWMLVSFFAFLRCARGELMPDKVRGQDDARRSRAGQAGPGPGK